MEKLILVNKKDEIKGYKEKEKCHQGKGILHRGFAVFIFNDKNQLLIQKRSELKNYGQDTGIILVPLILKKVKLISRQERED